MKFKDTNVKEILYKNDAMYLKLTVLFAESMYVFEGHDYSKEPSDKDKSAFDELIAGIFCAALFRPSGATLPGDL